MHGKERARKGTTSASDIVERYPARGQEGRSAAWDRSTYVGMTWVAESETGTRHMRV